MIGGKVFKKDDNSQGFIDEFVKKFYSLFWFSYRKDFASINPASYTSDVGWGCMLRSGQMMLARALTLHMLGGDWKRVSIDKSKLEEPTETPNSKYITILKWFEDASHAPYSVHQIARLGIKYGKNIGEWFGPSTISQVLGDLVSIHRPDNMAIYVSSDSVLYWDEIASICKNKSGGWDSIFILIPLRLGTGSLVNKAYLPQLKELFSIPQFLGILGGKPRAAYYFVAVQDTSFFYLDPHVSQSFVLMADNFATESYHCNIPQKMPMASIDPSLAIGFYCRDKEDLHNFWINASKLNQQENPLFGVESEAPEYRKKKNDSLLEEFEDDIVLL